MKNVKFLLLLSIIMLAAFTAFSKAKDKKLIILYSNDLHSHLEPHIVPWVSKTRKVGGFASGWRRRFFDV